MEVTVRQKFDHFVLILIKTLVVNFHTPSFWAADIFFQMLHIENNFCSDLRLKLSVV